MQLAQVSAARKLSAGRARHRGVAAEPRYVLRIPVCGFVATAVDQGGRKSSAVGATSERQMLIRSLLDFLSVTINFWNGFTIYELYQRPAAIPLPRARSANLRRNRQLRRLRLISFSFRSSEKNADRRIGAENHG